MTPLLDVSVLFTAFIAGFLGSGHCFGMCGGIATGLGSLGGQESPTKRLSSALLFNTGRLLSYAILGSISAWIMLQAGEMLHIPSWGKVLRHLTSLMIFIIGLQFLFDLQLLAFIERAGSKVWKYIFPLAVKASSLPGGTGRLLLGLCWGLLPCGLVYSLILTAAASGSPVSGAAIMFVFGMGTLPSMLGMSMAAPLVAGLLTDKWTRKIIGISLISLALLSTVLMNTMSHM